jgi:hypothetical protein
VTSTSPSSTPARTREKAWSIVSASFGRWTKGNWSFSSAGGGSSAPHSPMAETTSPSRTTTAVRLVGANPPVA